MRGGQGYEEDNEKRKNGQENFEGLDRSHMHTDASFVRCKFLIAISRKTPVQIKDGGFC